MKYFLIMLTLKVVKVKNLTLNQNDQIISHNFETESQNIDLVTHIFIHNVSFFVDGQQKQIEFSFVLV